MIASRLRQLERALAVSDDTESCPECGGRVSVMFEGETAGWSHASETTRSELMKWNLAKCGIFPGWACEVLKRCRSARGRLALDLSEL